MESTIDLQADGIHCAKRKNKEEKIKIVIFYRFL